MNGSQVDRALGVLARSAAIGRGSGDAWQQWSATTDNDNKDEAGRVIIDIFLSRWRGKTYALRSQRILLLQWCSCRRQN